MPYTKCLRCNANILYSTYRPYHCNICLDMERLEADRERNRFNTDIDWLNNFVSPSRPIDYDYIEAEAPRRPEPKIVPPQITCVFGACTRQVTHEICREVSIEINETLQRGFIFIKFPTCQVHYKVLTTRFDSLTKTKDGDQLQLFLGGRSPIVENKESNTKEIPYERKIDF